MVRFLLISIAVSLASPLYAQAEAQTLDPRIAAYQAHRIEHSEGMKAEQRAFENAVKSLEADVQRAHTDAKREADEISRLQSELSEANLSLALANGVYYPIVSAIFPMLTILGATNTLGFTDVGDVKTWASVFFVITLINMFLVLVFREKEIFQKYKKHFLWLLVVVLLIAALPAVAQGQQHQEEVTNKLKLVNEILGKSDHQRYIAILEAQLENTITIPSLASGDPLLFVLSPVHTNSAEYYFSLAALYTHENMLGKAVDSITAISSVSIPFDANTRDKIVINSIKFLLKQNRRQAASDMLEQSLPQLSDVEQILELSKFLSDEGMSTSADSTRSHAIKQAKTVSDLLYLATFFEAGTDYDRATSALERAATLCKTPNELVAVLRMAAQLSRDEIVENLVNLRLPTIAPIFEQQIPVLDTLIELGRREEATQLITNAVSGITPAHKNRVASLTYIIEESLNRNFTEQALNATMKLASYLGKNAFDYQIKVPPNMESTKGLELPGNKISLPLFSGLLNEESGFNDMAEINYTRAVLSTLERVATSYGYELPDSLTDFQLLGRIWEQGREAVLLEELDAVFIRLEQHQLMLLKTRNQASLDSLKLQQDNLRSEQVGAQGKKSTLIYQIKQKKSEYRKRLLMIFSAVIFTLLVVAVAAWKAVAFARLKLDQKTYAGTVKFIETLGWIQVLSILNIVIGVSVIVIAQFFMLFHRNAENTSSKNA